MGTDQVRRCMLGADSRSLTEVIVPYRLRRPRQLLCMSAQRLPLITLFGRPGLKEAMSWSGHELS